MFNKRSYKCYKWGISLFLKTSKDYSYSLRFYFFFKKRSFRFIKNDRFWKHLRSKNYNNYCSDIEL